MPKGHSLSIHALFSGKKRTSMYISWGKAIIITSKHGTTIFSFHYNIFLGKLEEKLARKARANILREYIGSCSRSIVQIKRMNEMS